MGEILSIKTEQDGLQVEYEVVPPLLLDHSLDARQVEIIREIDSIDKLMAENQKLINEYNTEIEKLTNQADTIDYSVAVSCGVLSSLVDAFFVGEFDFEGSWEKINKKFQGIVSNKADKVEKCELEQKINKAIENARKKAYENGKTFDDSKAREIENSIRKNFDKQHDIEAKVKRAIEKAKEKGINVDENEINEKILNGEMARKIKKLEDTYGIPSDSVWEDTGYEIDPKSHHLDDLAHHPTIIGWIASILTQFTGNTYFQNKKGKNIKFKGDKIRVIDNVNAYIEYGGVNIIEKTTKSGKKKKALEVTLVGDDFKSKLACGTFNWIGHLISDIAGSNKSARKGNAGMGLPGPLLSSLKEFARLPLIRNSKLPQLLNDLFTRDDALFGKYRMDLRSELAFGVELGKQAVPVFLNECLVRAFFFIRRIVPEVKAAKTLGDINWDAALPWKNRTIARMLTISYGTFEAIDLGEAAIRGAINSGGSIPGFFSCFVLRVNFVGIGRFAIACGSDISMGIKKEQIRNKRIETYIEQIFYNEAKLYYKQANMWVSARNAGDTINDAYKMIDDISKELAESMKDIQKSMKHISSYYPNLEKNNPKLLEEIDDILEWG